jgi:hypothetical protein
MNSKCHVILNCIMQLLFKCVTADLCVEVYVESHNVCKEEHVFSCPPFIRLLTLLQEP